MTEFITGAVIFGVLLILVACIFRYREDISEWMYNTPKDQLKTAKREKRYAEKMNDELDSVIERLESKCRGGDNS